MDKHKDSAGAGGKRPLRAWAVVLLDLLAVAIGLNAFALAHFVLDYYRTPAPQPVPLVLATPAPTPAPAPAPSAETEAPEETESVPARVYTGPWGEKFAEQLTEGEVIETEDSYRSANVSVTVRHVEEEGLVYSIEEIYVSDIRFLRTAFGPNGYGTRGTVDEMAAQNAAVAAISGDHFHARLEGPVVRNGELYRDTRFQDVCILLTDGRMLTVSDDELDMEELKNAAPWQVWSFGPMLLKDGKAMEEFNSTVTGRNPRSAIGYVEPGHYFFVQVDGRGAYNSNGMTMRDLALLFESLGCQTAYNLDGGASAGMAWNGELISFPYGRPVSDIIYVTDHPEEAEG